MARKKSNLSEEEKLLKKQEKEEKKRIEKEKAEQEFKAVAELKISDCLTDDEINNLITTVKKYKDLKTSTLISVLCNKFIDGNIKLVSRNIWE